MVSKADLEYLRELKRADPFTGYRDTTPTGEDCKIQILGRGEMAFYQQGNRALLLEVLAGRGVVFAYSIRRWDDRKKVTDEERETILEMMSRVMHKLGHETVEIVRK